MHFTGSAYCDDQSQSCDPSRQIETPPDVNGYFINPQPQLRVPHRDLGVSLGISGYPKDRGVARIRITREQKESWDCRSRSPGRYSSIAPSHSSSQGNVALTAPLGEGAAIVPVQLAVLSWGSAAPKPKPAGGPSGGSKDLDLSDFFDKPEDRKTTTTKAPKLTTTKAPKRKPQPKPQPANPNDFDLADALDDKNDCKKDNNGANPNDFDLADALDDKNDRKKDNNGGGGSISDKDLEDILGDGYSPDRKKGGGSGGGGGNVPSDDPGYGGIASAIGMALVGVVTSYISYQKKKLCFSIQAQQTLLQSPMTDPTSQDVARV
ncbi:CD99 antigen-like protein 2 [Acipenser ruthenus]|uniref:CD99 antigen-like protein 2 n=1 Tax=Acipenser ruthenus TaxID=7906 RepID=A0A444V1E3_ACIRT|nr:CD99 antigen-like protein 2 [Acipenser ruthenus]